MSPFDALRLLDQITGQVNLTRDQHRQIVAAIAVLDALIEQTGCLDLSPLQTGGTPGV